MQHERRHVPVGPNPRNFSSGIDHRGQVPGWGHGHPPCPRGSTRFLEHLRVVDLTLRLRSAAVHQHPNPHPMRSVPPDRAVPLVFLCAPPVSPRKPKTSLKYPSFNASASPTQIFRAEAFSLILSFWIYRDQHTRHKTNKFYIIFIILYYIHFYNFLILYIFIIF